MNREQQLLLLFQRKQIVESETTESEDNPQFARNFFMKLESQNPWERIFALGKIFHILKEFENSDLSELDKRLIEGIYSRKTNEYQYLNRKNERLDSDLEDHSDSKDEPSVAKKTSSLGTSSFSLNESIDL